MAKVEQRTFRARARVIRTAAGKPQLDGYAAVYNSLSDDLSSGFGGGFREKLAPGCFDKVLRSNPDVRLLREHDPSQILARTKSATLSLDSDNVGLHFRATVADTQLGKDTVELVSRGDLDSMSFGFTVGDQEWLEEKADDGSTQTIRTLVTIESLMDVSVVAYPAYPQTSVGTGARSLWPDGIPVEVRSHPNARVVKVKRLSTGAPPLTAASMKARARALQIELGLRSRADADDETDCDCPCENCEAGDCQSCNCVEGCDGEGCGHDSCNCSEHRLRRPLAQGRTIHPAGSDLTEYIANRDLESKIWDARMKMRLMRANAR